MKRGSRNGGYTIVEVLIVLAVSAVLFASAYATIGGQSRRTEFATAMRDTELIIQDITNDVATGYYARTGNFSCREVSGKPFIDTAISAAQGTNQDCTFIGRAIQFGVTGSTGNAYNVYDIVGLKTAPGTSRNVRSLSEASPIILNTTPIVTTLPGGLEVKKMTIGGGADVGTVAFITNLASSGGSVTNESGSQTVDVYPLAGTQINQDSTSAAAAVAGLIGGGSPNPAGGIVICLEGSVNNSYGEITIGAQYGRAITKTEVKVGNCP